ncbi:TOMM precursor leader peptide-binding protein [Streptomyces albiaxialis]|uniref:TOMM leader peptide-binding protein n=1 Tax=Streptomyces albiaxialis TaxID=329523 RepID=A0ABN2VYC2_9ACTN
MNTLDHGCAGVGFKRHLTPAVVPGDATYLVSEQGVTALEGDAVAVLAPLLDGSRDLPALVRETRGTLTPARLGGVLGALTRAGLVGRSGPPARPGARNAPAAFWEAAGLEGEQAEGRLAAGGVRLLALPGTDAADEAAEALRASGIAVRIADRAPEGAAGTDGSPDNHGPDGRTTENAGTDSTARAALPELTVVLCEDYLSDGLAAVDAAQRAAGRPWLLAKPSGVTPWIGPVFQPGAGACWHCLAHRLRQHRQPELYLGEALGLRAPLVPPRAATAASLGTALRLVALQAEKWLTGFRHESQSAVWALDALRLESRHHRLERRPQCAACGDPELVSARVRRPVALASRPKRSVSGGGHRAMDARQVLERYEHLVGDVTGVVRTLRRDPRCPEAFNAYVSGSNPALAGGGLTAFRAGLRSQSGGKGVTELDAKVGALCEALERYSATLHGDEPRVRGSLAELGEDAVHPNDCQLYHQRQFAGRRAWNAAQPEFQYVCEPFDSRAALDWTPVWSLTQGRHRLLPTAMLYFCTREQARTPYVRADSNGNAAGSSLEDAVLQGFLELVERDAVALWWYNRTRQATLDLDSFGDSGVDRMRAAYQELGRELWALDLTTDLGIPAVAALSRRTDGPREDVLFGFGCHFDPGIALRRAVTEMNQFLPAVTGGPPVQDRSLLEWCRRVTVEGQPYLSPDPGAAPVRAADFGYRPREDLLDDVHAAERLVREHGMELLVLDQTRPDLGIPAVKVLVPGLRHFWARFAPGRLYDVPVRLGRQPEPTPYERLNPIPVFV